MQDYISKGHTCTDKQNIHIRIDNGLPALEKENGRKCLFVLFKTCFFVFCGVGGLTNAEPHWLLELGDLEASFCVRAVKVGVIDV